MSSVFYSIYALRSNRMSDDEWINEDYYHVNSEMSIDRANYMIYSDKDIDVVRVIRSDNKEVIYELERN